MRSTFKNLLPLVPRRCGVPSGGRWWLEDSKMAFKSLKTALEFQMLLHHLRYFFLLRLAQIHIMIWQVSHPLQAFSFPLTSISSNKSLACNLMSNSQRTNTYTKTGNSCSFLVSKERLCPLIANMYWILWKDFCAFTKWSYNFLFFSVTLIALKVKPTLHSWDEH